jgi:hypothetical protein
MARTMATRRPTILLQVIAAALNRAIEACAAEDLVSIQRNVWAIERLQEMIAGVEAEALWQVRAGSSAVTRVSVQNSLSAP